MEKRQYLVDVALNVVGLAVAVLQLRLAFCLTFGGTHGQVGLPLHRLMLCKFPSKKKKKKNQLR